MPAPSVPKPSNNRGYSISILDPSRKHCKPLGNGGTVRQEDVYTSGAPVWKALCRKGYERSGLVTVPAVVWPASEPSVGSVLWPGVPGHRDEAGLRGTHHTISRSARRVKCNSGSRLLKGSSLWVSGSIPSGCSSLLNLQVIW